MRKIYMLVLFPGNKSQSKLNSAVQKQIGSKSALLFDRHTIRKVQLMLLFSLISGWSFGQSIFTNPITGTNPNTSNPYTAGQTVNGNITVSGIGRGSGITSVNNNNRYNASGWNSSSINLNDYFEFTLTPNSCFEIDFVSFAYTGQLSTGSISLAFRSSVDGFTNNIGTPNTGGTTISLSNASYQDLTSAITFRLYAWGASAAGTSYSINDFTFNGTVSSRTPTISSSTPGSSCGAGTVTLGATSSLGTINWFAASTGGASLGSGNSFTTPSISSTTTYFAEGTNGTCLSAARTAVVATINAIPTVSSSTPGSNCGTGTVTIGATASAGTINWYAASTGGASLGSGNSFTTPSISAATNYYAEANNSGCLSVSRTAVAATINPIPTITGNTPASRCGTGTVTLGATASAGTLNWYAASTGGASLGTGTSFTTPSISTTTNYFVDATNNGCTTASRTSVAATINAIPTITGNTPASRCSTGTVTLGATASAGTINWYAASTGGASLGTGTSYTTPSISSTTSYFVDATNNGCTTASRTAVAATINAIPTVASSTPGSRCGTGAVVLAATASVGTINWFAASTGGASLGTGNSYTTPSIATATNYFAQANNNGCLSASRTSVTATINAVPTITSSTPGSRCGTGTVLLGAASANTINWFAASSGGASLASGITFTTPSISATTTYYAESTTGLCVSASRTAVVATVNTIPTIATTTPASRCSTGTVALAATASAGTVNWYTASTGGTSLATSTSYTTPSISATTTYFVDATSTGCTSPSRTAVVATVNAIPTITGSTPGSNCGTGTVSLGATASAGTINWYTASSGGSSIGTGTSFTTPSIASTTTYFADATNLGCTTASRTAIIATINPIPTITSTTPGSFCGPASISLLATASAGTLNWFAASTGGTSLGSTGSFNTPVISSTTTYHVSATSNGCTSARTAVAATINPIPALTITPNYCSGGGLVVLSATSGLSGYSWNTGATTQLINVDQAGFYSVTANNAFGCPGNASINVANELVTNGTFSSGNTGFTTNYTFQADIAGQVELYPEGTYSIVPNANTVHNMFYGKDRTTGTGNIMVINGSPALGAQVWNQNNITVIPNTTYYFSAWAMSVVNGNNAVLQFSINGNQVGTIAFLPNGYSNVNGPYTWVRFYGQWNSGPTTAANLSILNLNTILGGNDFALDDISFGTLSPVSLSLNLAVNGNGGTCVGSPLLLTANAVGGASPFTYAWTGPNGFTSASSTPVITNAANATHNGTYSLTLTDGFGCTVTQSIVVAVSPLPVNQTLSAVSATICSGASTSIQLASTESGVFYQLKDFATDLEIGNEVQGTGASILLPTGILNSTSTFKVSAIRYTTDCSFDLTGAVTVNVSTTPVLAITNQAACSGTVNLTAAGVTTGSTGSGTLTYWTNAGATTALSTPTAVASSGTYFIRSANGSCIDIEPVVVSISAAPTATFSYPGTPFCSSETDPLPTFSGSAIAGVFSSTAGLVFRSTSSGLIDLSASTAGTYTVTNRITPSGACAAVTATSSVTITAAPLAGFSYVSNDLCQSANAANASPIFEAGAVAGTFTTSAGLSLVSSTTGVINISASTPGNYAVVNSLAATGGCAATADTFFVDINPYIFTGSLSSSSSDDILCAGESVNLFASATSYQTILLREGFNGSISNWVTTNSSTGGTPANAAWRLREDDYEYSGNDFQSNDQTQFYLSNSQAQGSGGTTNTILRSPMMSSVGFSTLSLDFFHFFDYRSSVDLAKVQVSTNNTAWTDLASYTSDQGSFTGFANAVINLNAYIGQPSLYIRFVFTATNDRYWAIDNVSITGASTNYDYNWNSSPSGFSSALQNPSGLVPADSKFYVVTATNSYGCSVPTTPLPVTVNPLPADNAGVDKVICGSGSVTIGAAATSGNTYSWSPATDLSSASVSDPTASPTSNTTYTLTETVTATGCSLVSDVVVSLNALPIIASTTPGSSCGTGAVTISASSSTGVVKWYAAATGGSALATSDSYTTPSISTSTTYYADATTTGCTAASRTAVVASIVAPPTIASQSTAAASYSQNVTATELTVTANAGSGTITSYQWYSSATASNASGTLINGATNSSYIPSTATVGTLYYYCLVTNSNNCTVKSSISGAIITLTTPVISSVIPTLPLLIDQAENTGYRGQRITINGSNFASNATVSFNGTAAIAVVFVNASQITAIVNNVGANSTGNVVVTNPSSGAFGSAAFSYIGYLTTAAGDWSTAGPWLGGTLPTAGSDVTIGSTNTCNVAVSTALNLLTIRPSSSLGLGAVSSSITTTDINIDGSLTFSSTGSLSISGNLNVSTTGVLTPGSGTINYTGSADQVLFTGVKYLEFNILNLVGTGRKGLDVLANVKASNINVFSGGTFAPGTNFQEVIVTGNISIQGDLDPGNSEFRFTGSSNQDLSMIGTGTILFSTMSINKTGGTLTLTDNVQVRDTLKLISGNMSTQSNLLEIGYSTNHSGVISYASGYVSGKLRRWYGATTNSGASSGLFPLGQLVGASWKNRNVLLEYDIAPATGGHLTIEFMPIPMINGAIGTQQFIYAANTGGANFTVNNFSNEGYWKIDNQASTLIDGEYAISLTGEGIVPLTGSMSELTIVKRVSGGDWFCPGTHVAPTGSLANPVLKRTGVSGFSNFGFGGGINTVLPITLTNFSAVCDGSEVLVYWTTASEANNKEFYIEESGDAINWKTLNTVPGAGNSNSTRHYSEKVSSDFNGGSYFRLTQTDFNGDSETFDPIYVNCAKGQTNELSIYPNPVIETATVAIKSSVDMKGRMTLFSASGQILLAEQINITTGSNSYRIDLSNLPSGSYYLNITNDKNLEISGSRSIIKR